ncbi:PO11 protein, partial [Pseudoatta argentina]
MSVDVDARSTTSENSRKSRPDPTCSKVGARAETATSEGALSRAESTASLGSLGGESPKRTVEFVMSSTDSERESSKRPRGRPALNPENVGKFTAEARAIKADKAKARQLRRDHRAINKSPSNKRRGETDRVDDEERRIERILERLLPRLLEGMGVVPVMAPPPKAPPAKRKAASPQRAREQTPLSRLRVKVPGVGRQASGKRAPLPKLRSPGSATITVTLIWEVKGPESRDKAEKLAERLAAVFADRDDVKVSRPTKTAEIRGGAGCAAARPKIKRGGQKPSGPLTTTVAEQTPAAVTTAEAPSAVLEMAVVAEVTTAAAREAAGGANVGEGEVAGCYFLPRLGRKEYEDALESLGEHICRRSPRPILVGGDFNAHALEWGSPSTDPRGNSTLLWAARYGLVLLNRSRASTFVGARGESIVDLTWATPAAAIKIGGWHVDADSLGEMTDRSDSTLLWAARHGLVLLNRGRSSTFMEARGESIVDLTWATPAAAIKIRGWHVDAGSLGEVDPPITEILDARFLEDVVAALFPTRERDIPERAGPPSGWTEELSVTGVEMKEAFARLAPGPSGVYGRVWLAAAPIVGDRLRQLFMNCLREGIFPRSWKRARLVLLRKEGKPAESPSAYRLICLLDDAGKLLERVIAARIVRHLSRDGPDLSRGQWPPQKRRRCFSMTGRAGCPLGHISWWTMSASRWGPLSSIWASPWMVAGASSNTSMSLPRDWAAGQTLCLASCPTFAVRTSWSGGRICTPSCPGPFMGPRFGVGRLWPAAASKKACNGGWPFAYVEPTGRCRTRPPWSSRGSPLPSTWPTSWRRPPPG